MQNINSENIISEKPKKITKAEMKKIEKEKRIKEKEEFKRMKEMQIEAAKLAKKQKKVEEPPVVEEAKPVE